MDSDTPFVAFLEPCELGEFQPGVPRDRQPASIPSLFIDAAEIRQKIFAEEQDVPLEFEFDDHDSRSCHWVIYANVDRQGDVALHGENGRLPVGTIRLVPFPHEPHPKIGGRYWKNVLEGSDEDPASLETANGAPVDDRPTSFHDGKEPYVKLGRLAVEKEFRGKGMAGLLVKTALHWMKAHPSYFDAGIAAQGMDAIKPSTTQRWKGLVCAHAQEHAIGAWEKWGFQLDEAMGKWWEEGIPHVGMFQRLRLEPDKNRG